MSKIYKLMTPAMRGSRTVNAAHHVVLAAQQNLGRIQTNEIDIDGDFSRFATQFEPAIRDKAIAAMDYMSRYRLVRAAAVFGNVDPVLLAAGRKQAEEPLRVTVLRLVTATKDDYPWDESTGTSVCWEHIACETLL